MTNTRGEITNIRDGIQRRLGDDTNGRRSIHWLSDKTGIPYSTLQQKLSKRPGKLTTDDLVKIADAFGVALGDLDKEDAAA